MKEYPIFGIAPGSDMEQLLYTKATTREEAERIAKLLESKHGCKAVRIWEFDPANCDVQRMFRQSVRV